VFQTLRSLRGPRVVTAVVIISQASFGAVKSTTARSRGLKMIKNLALFKFLFASPYIRQIAGSGPEDLRRGPIFASLSVMRLSRDFKIGSVSDSGSQRKQ
jgi:hypothetical protein